MTAFTIGTTTIERIEETVVAAMPPEMMLPGIDVALVEQHRSWLAPSHITDDLSALTISIHSWLVRTPELLVLVDACVGNHKERTAPQTAEFHGWDTGYLQRLADAGVRPEDIDVVVCTHLHVDHCGWNTRLVDGRWVPTFPNARHVFARDEYDYWRSLPADHFEQQVFADSVEPVVDAGLAQFVGADADLELAPGLRLVPTPGHTPGHLMLEVTSDGRTAVFTGDLMHHVLQVYSPTTNSIFCEDPDLAAQTRAGVLRELCDTDTLVLPAHFAAPHAGWIRSDGDSFRFEFVS